MSDIFGIVVERIDDEQTYIGLPDTRGLYHQIQIDEEQLRVLHRRIEERLQEIGREYQRLMEADIKASMQKMVQSGELIEHPDGTYSLNEELSERIDEKPRANYPASLDDWERMLKE
jgi:hypothetical protein